MKFLAVIATVVATAAASEYPVFPFVWNDCSPPGTADQTVTNFTLKPTFCPGKNYTVISTGLISKDIIAPAKLQIHGKYLGRVVYTDSQDLCALLAASGTPCPVAAGTAALSFDVLLKPTWPMNWVNQFTYQANNGNNHILFCQAANMVALSTNFNGPCAPIR